MRLISETFGAIMGKIEDDPTYNQPKPSIQPKKVPAGKEESNYAKSEGLKAYDDPTYNQPKRTPGGEDVNYPKEPTRPIDGRDGTGPLTEDPTYDRPRSSITNSRSIADDPTYNQPRRTPVSGNDSDYPPAPSQQPTGKRDGTGTMTEDPTYDRPRPSSTEHRSIADDPTYNQPTSTPAGGGGDANHTTSTRSSQSIADDPTYNQPRPISANGTNNSDDHSPQPKSQYSIPVGGGGENADDSSPTRGVSADDPVYSQKAQSRATSRLTQLTSQISPPASEPNTSKPRRRKQKPKDYQSALPADYSDILDHISKMQHHARNPPASDRGYTRQIRDGKLTSRQRIDTILNPGTFRELGSVTGRTTWSLDPNNPLTENVEDFTPSNNPQGFGQITCLKTGNMPPQTRQIYLTSDDFAIRGGHADGHNGLKTLYGEKLVLRLKVPAVKLVDGSSGGGSVTTIATTGYSYLPHVTLLRTVVKQLNAGIPNLGAVVGPAIGLGAARVVSTHFSVMAADIGSLFNAGPKVVEGATFEEGLSFQDLGGPWVHCCNGTIDNMAANEKECYEQIRTVLGYLPDCGNLQAPPCYPADWSGDDVNREDEKLRSIVPRKKNRMYNPYTIIESVVDRGSWFEIGRLWGRTGIVGLARLGGKPVAILSNNCEVNGGALDALGSQKMLKHIKFADVFNLPIVQFVDVRKLLPS